MHKQVLVFRAVCVGGAVNWIISLTLQASVLTNHPRLSTGDHLRHAAAQPGSTKTAIQPRGPPIYSPICSPADPACIVISCQVNPDEAKRIATWR